MGIYNPWHVLAALPHLTLTWKMLHGRLGEYHHHRAEIVLDPRLPFRQRRCTLAHELHHAHRGDVPTGNKVLDARQELVADKAAARALLEIRAVIEALMWTDGHVPSAAQMLSVDTATLETRLRHLHPAERHFIKNRLEEREGSC